MKRRTAYGLALVVGLVLVVWWRWPYFKFLLNKHSAEGAAAAVIIRFPGVHKVTVIDELGARHLEVAVTDAVDDPAVFSGVFCKRVRDAGASGVMIRVVREPDGKNVWTGTCNTH